MRPGAQLQGGVPSEEGRVAFVPQRTRESQDQRPEVPRGRFLRIGTVPREASCCLVLGGPPQWVPVSK